MQSLIVDDFGTYLGKRSERVSVRYRDKDCEKEEHPLMDLDQIIITSRGVSMSSDLIEACTERGIEIAFLSFNGKPYAKLNSPSLTATVISRREQLAAYHDERGLEIAKQFATGKLRNQINLIRYFGKYRKKQAPKKYAELIERLTKIEGLIDEIRHVQSPTSQPPACPRGSRDRGGGTKGGEEPRSTTHAVHCSTLKDAPVPSTGNASNGCCPPDASLPETIKAQSTTSTHCSTTATGYSTPKSGAHSHWLVLSRLPDFCTSTAPANPR